MMITVHLSWSEVQSIWLCDLVLVCGSGRELGIERKRSLLVRGFDTRSSISDFSNHHVCVTAELTVGSRNVRFKAYNITIV
jgi:hypothetical protein